MGLYLGSNKKHKLTMNNMRVRLNIIFSSPIVNGILLKSSDGYTLKDSNNRYLTVKEEE